MLNDQAATLRALAAHKASHGQRAHHSRVIVIASGKGGVGKTNIAVNLGIAWAERGLKVAILDADMGLANVDIVLGINPRYNLSHVINGERTLMEVMVKGPQELGIIAGGSGIAELADIGQYKLERFIDGLSELDESLDILLIDTGAGISRSVLSFALASDETLVVATPDPTSIADAYGLIKVVALRNPQAQVRVIVNMCESQKNGEEVFYKLDSVARRFLSRELDWAGSIPRDVMVQRAVQEFQPFYIAYPRCKAAVAIGQMADRLLDEGPRTMQHLPSTNAGGISGLFRRVMHLVRH
ncbi:MAG: MinD/ParA family protein [Firmicutes bacterium]|nr:MinD/ParA family protein [Bacillota bacterium]